MPTLIEQDWANPLQYIRKFVCKPWTWTNNPSSQEMVRRTTVYNDPQSRVKPVDLVMNMTNLAKQSKTTINRMHHGPFLYQKTNDTSCPAPVPKYETWAYLIGSTGRSQIVSSSSATWSSDTDLDIRLKIKESSINLGTALAEYRQSARMFGSAATAVVNAWKVFKGKRPRQILTPCMVPASYLVYTYGVAPLVGDLYNSVEELALRLGFPVRKRYFASAKGHAKGGSSATVSGLTTDIDARMSRTKRVTAYVEFDVENASRFTSGNILEIGWEVIPYSFVVDWMFSIGDYLSSLDALRAVETMRVSTVIKENYFHNTKLKYVNTYGVTYSNHPKQYIFESHERIVGSSIPLPGRPTWRPSRSYKAVINGLALLWQSFANRKGNCKPRFTPGGRF